MQRINSTLTIYSNVYVVLATRAFLKVKSVFFKCFVVTSSILVQTFPSCSDCLIPFSKNPSSVQLSCLNENKQTLEMLDFGIFLLNNRKAKDVKVCKFTAYLGNSRPIYIYGSL